MAKQSWVSSIKVKNNSGGSYADYSTSAYAAGDYSLQVTCAANFGTAPRSQTVTINTDEVNDSLRKEIIFTQKGATPGSADAVSYGGTNIYSGGGSNTKILSYNSSHAISITSNFNGATARIQYMKHTRLDSLTEANLSNEALWAEATVGDDYVYDFTGTSTSDSAGNNYVEPVFSATDFPVNSTVNTFGVGSGSTSTAISTVLSTPSNTVTLNVTPKFESAGVTTPAVIYCLIKITIDGGTGGKKEYYLILKKSVTAQTLTVTGDSNGVVSINASANSTGSITISSNTKWKISV